MPGLSDPVSLEHLIITYVKRVPSEFGLHLRTSPHIYISRARTATKFSRPPTHFRAPRAHRRTGMAARPHRRAGASRRPFRHAPRPPCASGRAPWSSRRVGERARAKSPRERSLRGAAAVLMPPVATAGGRSLWPIPQQRSASSPQRRLQPLAMVLFDAAALADRQLGALGERYTVGALLGTGRFSQVLDGLGP